MSTGIERQLGVRVAGSDAEETQDEWVQGRASSYKVSLCMVL
jgi:hypothetical protein